MKGCWWSMKLDLNLQELIELKSALVEKKSRLEETNKTDKSISSLLNADSVETIEALLDKLDQLFISYR